MKNETKDCFDLIMRKQNALDILSGKKKIEIRNCSNFYIQRFMNREKGKENEMLDIFKIHFHDYANKWFLDVECEESGFCCVDTPTCETFFHLHGFHDFDEQAKEFDALPQEEKPMVFYFLIYRVLDTNLTN